MSVTRCWMVLITLVIAHTAAIAQDASFIALMDDLARWTDEGPSPKSLRLAEEYCADCADAFGPASAEYAKALLLRAPVESALERHSDAVRTATEAVRILRDAHDERLGNGLTVLAMASLLAGDAGRAREASDDAFAWFLGREATMDGPDAGVLLSLAQIVGAHGLHEWAVPLHELGLRVQQRLGSESMLEAVALGSYAQSLRALGRQADAEAAVLEQLRMVRAVNGADSPMYAGGLVSTGIYYDSTGRPEKAEELYREALAIRAEIQGTDHPEYATVLSILGKLCMGMGRLDEARSLLEESLRIDEAAFGSMHEECATGHRNLGDLEYRLHDYEAAFERYAQALEIREATLGADHLDCEVVLRDLSDVYTKLGRMEEAWECLLRALRIARAHADEEPLDVAHALNAVAVWLMDAGRFDVVEELLNEAQGLCEGEMPDELLARAEVSGSLARLREHQGRLGEAEDILSEKVGILKRVSPDGADELVARIQMGRFLLDAGRRDEARELIEGLLGLSRRQPGSETHTAYAAALAGLAKAELLDGDVQSAHDRLVQCGDMLEGLIAPGSFEAESLEMQIALTEGMLGRLEAARARMDACEMEGPFRDLYEGILLLHERRPDRAARTLKRALESAEDRLGRDGAWRNQLLVPLGWALLHRGWSQEALATFDETLESALSLRSSLDTDTQRVGFANAVEDIHSAAALAAVQVKDYVRAFQLIEQGRARSLVEAMAGRQASPAQLLRDPELIALDAEISQLQRTQGSYALASADVGARAVSGVTSALKTRGTRRAELIERKERISSKVQQVVDPPPPDVRRVQQWVPQGDALLVYYHVGDIPLYAWSSDELWVFVLTSDAIELRTSAVRSAELEAAAETYVRLARDKHTNPAEMAELRARLHEWLIAPAADAISNAGTVYVVPWGKLSYLPWATLSEVGADPLVSRHAVVNLPTAAVCEYLPLPGTGAAASSVFAVGDPTTEHGSLPGAEQEAGAVGEIFARSTVLTRDEATETALRVQGAQRHVLHLACHGILNSETPQLSHLALAGDQRNDGRLEVHEIVAADLSSVALVTLSACSTAEGKLGGGSEVLSLARAFMFAGAPAVISTLWEVDDRATREFMVLFYKELTSGSGKADAMRAAQRALRSNPQYAHPYYWAPFVLWGN